jgi:acyl-CoA reductase-like NAD-dependent aldehyde dehydrogenase
MALIIFCLALMLLKFRHAGQACITANRVYVQRGVYGRFAEIVTKKTQVLKLGHGSESDTTMGPLTTPAGVAKTMSHLENGKTWRNHFDRRQQTS